MKDGKVGLAVIGAGWAGAMHILGTLQNDKAAFLGAYDSYPGAVRRKCTELGIGQDYVDYPDLDALLGDNQVDGIIVATRSDTHVPILLKALDAGKHVLCEKPVAVTYDDLQAARAAALQHRNLVTIVNLAIRNYDIPVLVKETVAAGKVGSIQHGRVTYCHRVNTGNLEELEQAMKGGKEITPDPQTWIDPKNWKFFKQYSGGAGPMGGLHAEDFARWIMQPAKVAAVEASASGPYHFRYYDHPTVWRKTLYFDNGKEIDVLVNIESPHGYDFHFEFEGDRGKVKFHSIVGREHGYDLLTKEDGQKQYTRITEESAMSAPVTGAVEHHRFDTQNKEFTGCISEGRQSSLSIPEAGYEIELMNWAAELSNHQAETTRIAIADVSKHKALLTAMAGR